MDDETAEIELLEQNLNKTRQISQRMTSILNSFDTRLAKLEKSILPLYNSTQILNRRASNIEKALLKIDEVASNQEGIAVEEALILRGPQPGQLDEYKDALERLNASIAFKSSDRDSQDTARLVETGAKKLTQLYTKLVAEGSSGSAPPPGSDITKAPFPSSLISNILPLVEFLKTLPLPSTHPSHPAAPAIMSVLKEAQRGYADMRGNWSRKCLEAQGQRVLDRADNIDPVQAGREFGLWVQSILTVVQEEYNLLAELSPLSHSSMISSSFSTLLKPVLLLLSINVSSLVGVVKRSLHKYGFIALAAYDSLANLQSVWDEVSSWRGSESRKGTDEFKEAVQAIRSLCLRMFPECLADIKLGATSRTSDTSVELLESSVSAVEFLNRLPEVLVASGDILMTLGDGNWKMGEGMSVTKSKTGGTDERVLLEHYVYDIVNTSVNTLNMVAKTQRRQPFGSIFLLNNISYLRKNISLDPKHDTLIDYLSKPTQEVLNSNYRTAKSGYFDSNFTPLMQALTDDPKEKPGKSATKEKFTRFYDLLEEVMERHKIARVLEDDPEERETIGNDVIKFLIPSLKAFTQKHREKEFSKNPQKYIKMSADAVESQLRSIYR
ncbi:exocyst complex exo70 subunit [Moniliophthora roreri MCA 2997]|uniref:Exocyst complex protein EXO70 n=1 Tax=Moniliophthora roreri (strain MCA 2997) TaxID=1381753 RepID=V2X1G6_MONRO|nr:exocyst complex exo70 subunit [Moniliophthora roreri MCA 2997]